MSFNKSQGQTLKKVGCYLPAPVFSHGQLYVALSRATQRSDVKVIVDRTDTQGAFAEQRDLPAGVHTQNVVWQEVLLNVLPDRAPLPSALPGDHVEKSISTTSKVPAKDQGNLRRDAPPRVVSRRLKTKTSLDDVPPYCERQQEARCGLHALNNAIGRAVFTKEDLTDATDALLFELSLQPNEFQPVLEFPQREDHELENGWYSEQVLAKALEGSTMYSLELQTLSAPAEMSALIADPDVAGALVNVPGAHWLALRFVHGCAWALDSISGPQKLGAIDSHKYRAFLNDHAFVFPAGA